MIFYLHFHTEQKRVRKKNDSHFHIVSKELLKLWRRKKGETMGWGLRIENGSDIVLIAYNINPHSISGKYMKYLLIIENVPPVSYGQLLIMQKIYKCVKLHPNDEGQKSINTNTKRPDVYMNDSAQLLWIFHAVTHETHIEVWQISRFNPFPFPITSKIHPRLWRKTSNFKNIEIKKKIEGKSISQNKKQFARRNVSYNLLFNNLHLFAFKCIWHVNKYVWIYVYICLYYKNVKKSLSLSSSRSIYSYSVFIFFWKQNKKIRRE